MILWLFVSLASGDIPVGGNNPHPFSVMISAEKEHLEYVQNLAEKEIVRDTSHCRGAMIAVANSNWNCQFEDIRVRCQKEFICRLAGVQYNRKKLSTDFHNKLKSFTIPPEKTYEIRFQQRNLDGKNQSSGKFFGHQKADIDEKLSTDPFLLYLQKEGISLDEIYDEEDLSDLIEKAKESEKIVVEEYDPLTESDVKWFLETEIDEDTKIYKLTREIKDESFLALNQWQIGFVQGVGNESFNLSPSFAWTPALKEKEYQKKLAIGIHQEKTLQKSSLAMTLLGLVQKDSNGLFLEVGGGLKKKASDFNLLGVVGTGLKANIFGEHFQGISLRIGKDFKSKSPIVFNFNLDLKY